MQIKIGIGEYFDLVSFAYIIYLQKTKLSNEETKKSTQDTVLKLKRQSDFISGIFTLW